MSILDENLYEKMRIILPQHKATLARYEQKLELHGKEKPLISEHQLAEFSTIISDAVLNQLEIRITFFKKTGDEVFVGVPFIEGGLLKLQTGVGIIRVQTDRVTNICAV